MDTTIKVKYGTDADIYWTTHGEKVPFFIPKFSIIKIIPNQVPFDNNKVDTGIGYGIILGRELIVQLGMITYFKDKILEWYVMTIHMKQPGCWSLGPGKSNTTKKEILKGGSEYWSAGVY